MVCSLFGLCLIGYIGYIILTNKNPKKLLSKMIVLTAVCSLNIRMGYMLKIGNSVVGFSSILVYLTGLISLLLIVQKKKVPRKLTIAVVGMILILGLGACRNIILPYKKSVVTGNWTDYVLGKNVESYISGQSLQIGYYLVLSFIGLILIASDILLDEYDFWDVLADVIKY